MVQTGFTPLRGTAVVGLDMELEGLEITNSVTDLAMFSQTKRSSDDLVASMNETPTPSPRVPSRSGMDTPPPIMKDLNELDTPHTLSPLSTKVEQHNGSETEAQSRNGTSTPTTSVPVTPSPAPQKLEIRTDGSESTPSSRRIPKYKIALVSSLLSPPRTGPS
jgi:hypothetical protein